MKHRNLLMPLMLALGCAFVMPAALAKHTRCEDKQKQLDYQLKQAQLLGDKTKETRILYQKKRLGVSCISPVISVDEDEQISLIDNKLAERNDELSVLTEKLTDAKNRKDAERALSIQKKIDLKKAQIIQLQNQRRKIEADKIHQQ